MFGERNPTLVTRTPAASSSSRSCRRHRSSCPGDEVSSEGPAAAQGDQGRFDLERAYDVLDVVRSVANNHGVSPAQVALNWLTRRTGVSSVIVGARNEEQLADNLAAVNWTLTNEELEQLNDLTVPRIIYPYWHQQFSAASPLGPADVWPRPALGTSG